MPCQSKGIIICGCSFKESSIGLVFFVGPTAFAFSSQMCLAAKYILFSKTSLIHLPIKERE